MKICLKIIFLAYLAKIIGAELKLLSVVLRHGDRAPDDKSVETYPNNPYANKSFYPIGAGGLTNIGSIRQYRLGQYLRRCYGDFLGPMYLKGVLNARTTNADRAQQSLQLVLAGLYPPKGDQIWNPKVNWQPIPITYIAHLEDILMYSQDCPRFLVNLEQAIESPEYQKKLKEFEPLMKNLTIATGKPINNTFDMYYLYHGLTATQEMNLQLPKWTDGIFPYGQLYDGTLLLYELFGSNDDLKRLFGGMLLRKFIDDMTDACEDKLEEPRKLFLYSGHKLNIAGVLQALGAYEPHIPKFASAVIVELHKENHECFVKIKYFRGFVEASHEDESINEIITVPGCTSTCPLSQLKKILKNHIATDDDIKSCDKRSIPELMKTHRNFPKYFTDRILSYMKEEKRDQYKLK